MSTELVAIHFYYGQILRDYNNEKTTLLFEENHHPGLYYISHLICSKSREFALKHKLGSWSYHIALLTKKRLGIKLNVSDKLVDKTVMQLIDTIETGFASACTDAISLIKQSQLEHNDHMLTEKTDLLIRNFTETYLDKRKSNVDNAQKEPIHNRKIPNHQALTDGIYIVNELKADKYNVQFRYGSKNYSYPNSNKLEPVSISSNANLTIKDAQILKIVS